MGVFFSKYDKAAKCWMRMLNRNVMISKPKWRIWTNYQKISSKFPAYRHIFGVWLTLREAAAYLQRGKSKQETHILCLKSALCIFSYQLLILLCVMQGNESGLSCTSSWKIIIKNFFVVLIWKYFRRLKILLNGLRTDCIILNIINP